MTKKLKKQKLKQKLTDKYRLVILNENTFQEKFSLKLSRLNVFVFGGLFSILLIGLTTLLIAFTGIREYIPGYSSTALKKKATRLTYEADSLKNKLAIITRYTKAIQPVLTGNITSEKIDSIITDAKTSPIDERKLQATKQDSVFRENVNNKNQFALSQGNQNRIKNVFFSP